MNILDDAKKLTSGSRQKEYGHPRDNFTRLAGLVNAQFAHKLKVPLTPADCAIIMCLVKIAREANGHSRDTLVDLAGYAWVAQELSE